MKFQFILLTLFLFFPASTSAQNAGQAIPLQKMYLPVTGRLAGITNIFFKKPGKIPIRHPQDWREIEIAPVLESSTLAVIFALRYKSPTGEVIYVADRNGDLDFRRERRLQFRQVGDLKIADFEAIIRPAGANKIALSKVSYQIALSGDGYTYARVSEYRRGFIRGNDKTYEINLRARSRNSPLFGLSADTVCLIDLNGDGEFSERWRLSGHGNIVPREEIELAAPFIVGEEKLKIVGLDPDGKSLKIKPSSEEVSISPGFKAPDFTLKGIDDNEYSLANLKGKIVLLQFWSISCPFCERILPEFNSLIEKKAGEDFLALDIAREEKTEEIKSYLKTHPRNATVVINDKTVSQIYNSQGITPTFYLIDPHGVIRLSGYGASLEQLRVIEKLVEQIKSGK